jgi:hypothetical protein
MWSCCMAARSRLAPASSTGKYCRTSDQRECSLLDASPTLAPTLQVQVCPNWPGRPVSPNGFRSRSRASSTRSRMAA